MSTNIKAVVGGPIAPNLKVRVRQGGQVEPTNPVIIAPTSYASDVSTFLTIAQEYADNAASIAYANAVNFEVAEDEDVDGGVF